MKIRKSINLQLVLPGQTYLQMFECVARCSLLKSKGGLKFLSLSVLSYYFVYRQVIYMFHTFTIYKFVLRFSLSASRVSICIRLDKTTEGSDNGVFFQIKENNFFSYSEKSLFWSGKTDYLLSCSALCARQASCRSANFPENP